MLRRSSRQLDFARKYSLLQLVTAGSPVTWHHGKLNATGILKVQLERLVFVPNQNVFLGNHSILERKRGNS